jgi:hypothetical protein
MCRSWKLADELPLLRDPDPDPIHDHGGKGRPFSDETGPAVGQDLDKGEAVFSISVEIARLGKHLPKLLVVRGGTTLDPPGQMRPLLLL